MARGEYLAFVDADMQVHPDTFNAIAAALDDPAIVGGASGIRPERWSVGIGVVYAITSLNALVTGIDAGLVYCRRADFVRLGGYDERRATLEDVDFLWRLKQLGRRHRQHLAGLHGAAAVFSTRKFDQFGDWHWVRLGAHVLRARGWRRDVRGGMAQRYWYDGRDE